MRGRKCLYVSASDCPGTANTDRRQPPALDMVEDGLTPQPHDLCRLCRCEQFIHMPSIPFAVRLINTWYNDLSNRAIGDVVTDKNGRSLTDAERARIADEAFRRRFWERVKETDNEPYCWEWKGYCGRKGYGIVGIGKRQFQAHRIAYEMLIASFPPHLHLHHLCRNTRCVRPAHLQLISAEEHSRIRPYAYDPEALGPRTSSRTHCIHGHLLDASNLRIRPRGDRMCLTCHREQTRARRGKLKLRLSSVDK